MSFQLKVTTTADFGAEFRQLILRVDENALTRKLSALIGVRPKKKLILAFAQMYENHSLERIVPIGYLCRE